MADEAYEEQHKFVARIIWGIFISIVLVWFCTLLFLPMTSWIVNGLGMEQLGKSWQFWKRCAFNVPLLVVRFKDVVVALQMEHSQSLVRYLPYLSFLISGTGLVYWNFGEPWPDPLTADNQAEAQKLFWEGIAKEDQEKYDKAHPKG